jgi:uncharacterized protein YaiL (DUF2058 family)
MGDSLQDQLRALGLADSRPEKRQRGSKGRPARRAGKTPGTPSGKDPGHELTLDQAYALREREEKRQAERTRRRKLEEERRRRELNRAIREIVTARRQNRDDADIARYFMYNGRIRKLYVTAEQQQALAADELGIVYLAGSYHLLEPEALADVRQLSVDHIVDLGAETASEDPDHPIPDDLVW